MGTAPRAPAGLLTPEQEREVQRLIRDHVPDQLKMSYGRRSGEDTGTTRQDHVQGPAQHPKTARESRTLLLPPGRKLCGIIAILSGRINI
jgi:hypothetical protein